MTCTCEGNATGIHLCSACCDRLELVLAEVDSVVGELVRAVPRASLTASYGERVSASGSMHAPLPINEQALDAHIALDKYLMWAALELAKTTRKPLTRRDSSGLSSYIYTNINTLRTRHWAAETTPKLSALIRECERATRTATQAEFAGTCQTEACGTELYTFAGADVATCRTCGAEYAEVQEWRTTAKAYAKTTDDNIVGYPQALSERLNKVHGQPIGADYIRVLANRGLITRANPEHGDDGKKLRAMYRLGDVKALIKPRDEEAA